MNRLQPELRELMQRSPVTAFFRYGTVICNRNVMVTFIFRLEQFDEVDLEVTDPVFFDLQLSLSRRYGEPVSGYPSPGLAGQTELKVIWKADGYEVETIQTDNGGASISFRRPRL
ncbi:MAG: hypothetical protein L0191_20520 [Acidobacteria bacterium]|nr:hypothetical protein [Acidobacteriota bacterium]